MCVLYLFCNGDNVTIAFTGVSSSSGAPIRSLIFQSCNPYGPALIFHSNPTIFKLMAA
jgi:hypothetical protein